MHPHGVFYEKNSEGIVSHKSFTARAHRKAQDVQNQLAKSVYGK